MDFESLHDAVVGTIEIDWGARTASVRLAPVVSAGRENRDAIVRLLGVSNIQIPHRAPWGDSIYVNSCRTPSQGVLEFEMQSGDVLVFEAATWEIIAIRRGEKP